MPGRKREPSFQLASGTTIERDNSYNISNTLGSIFYNTDTSNVEIRHEDPSNTLGWRDLVMNNKEQIDISGKLVVAMDASFQNNVDISGSLMVNGIPTSGGGGDVTLAGNPNAFSGTNTFDVNRPTSTLTSTPAATEFITKANGDALYGGDNADLAGGTTANPQIFTGVNEFDGTTNANVGLIEQTASHNNSFIQTSGEQTNFIRQNGTTKGFIIQEADDSGIRQDGENAEIKQTGDNADFRQQGVGCGIRQSGQYAIITQSGLNSVISSPRVRCNNLPLIGNDLCNKTYVDNSFVSLAAGTAALPQEVTGVCDFNGGSLQMSNPNQTLSMIQTDINTSDVNTLAMTGRRNRINQTGLSNGLINEFTQSGGLSTASEISQYTNSSIIYQDSVTAKFITHGRVGIGNITAFQTPIAPLEIQGSATSLNNGSNYGYLRNHATPYNYSANWGTYGLSIKASNIIFAGNYVLASDERIKRDITDLSSTLVLIDKIKPKTYKYRDTAEGDRMTYGFIAQELEQVIPEAIITTRDKIPNIMKTADVIDGVFILKEATDLIEGDVIAIYDDENKQYDVKITEIISDKSFKIDMVEDLQDQFFIYGKFVDDFKAIEHNDLLPVMIKSIQELNAKNKSLEERLAILEDKINNMP